MRAVQTKQCGTVSIITTVFNKVQEIMKTAKKAISPKKVKSLAKERSLPKKKQSTCSRGHAFLGTLRSDDGDGNGNATKAMGLISKTTILHVHHAFLYISLPSLHDYDVKMPNFAMY